ncbi:MAG: hypothetical protein GDA36_08655 [Rhodobacteraceae bacterium]|nr:hypothetical protein [Paracoccaceae bacterium]
MFGGSFDWAILSGPMALPGLTSGKAVLVVWVYAIAGVCGLRVILFVTPRRFCLIVDRQLGVLFWPARTTARRVIVA